METHFRFHVHLLQKQKHISVSNVRQSVCGEKGRAKMPGKSTCIKTVQIETRLSEYGGNKKAVWTDGRWTSLLNIKKEKTLQLFFFTTTP